MLRLLARVARVPLLASVLAAPAAGDWMVADPGQGAVPLLGAGAGDAAELSGITWTGGTSFAAVSDNGGPMFSLSVDLDTADGSIIAATLGAGTPLAGSDLEGIAFQPATGNVFVSDESGPQIRIHRFSDGAVVGSVALPPVYSAARPNLSLEALAWDNFGGFLWTANEEALSVDGPVSTLAAGTTVRLQRFDGSLQPAGQWAYVTDPLPGDIPPAGRDVEVSGVPGLIALPDGSLLALERALGNGVAIRHRLYQVDVSAATDTTAISALAGATFAPATKTLLWERNVLLTNYEGGTVGPPLADGAFSVLLVSDNGSNLNQTLYPLAVRPRICGDGVVGPPEQCDDGNSVSGDGCTEACVIEFCGDGVVNGGGERCDDGNDVAGDGCDANCALEREVVKCQEAVAKAGRTYATGRLKALQDCRNQLNKGKLLYLADVPTTPVTNPADCAHEERTVPSIARAAEKARAGILGKCSDSTLAGMTACAATIDGLIAADPASGCLVVSHDAAIETVLADQYGGIVPVQEGDRRSCQEAIAKNGLKLVAGRMKSLQSCRNQYNKGRALFLDADKQLPVADVSQCSAEYRTARKLARAGEQLRKGIVRRCTDTQIAALGGTCATSVAGLASADGAGGCLVDGAADVVDALLAEQY
jgi:cysteine-rich repeat protein